MLQSSFLNIILQGGTFSLVILAVLMVMSVISWAIIGQRWYLLSSSIRSADRFARHLDLENGFSDINVRADNFPPRTCLGNLNPPITNFH